MQKLIAIFLASPTQNDLAALFTVRVAGLYLRSGGRIGFILPMAALTRGQFERLRSGSFLNARIAWDEAWVMSDDLQPLFPVPSCVFFGRRRNVSHPIPDKVRAFSGNLPLRDASEALFDRCKGEGKIIQTDGAPALEVASFEGGSIYRNLSARRHALPRMLCFVERKSMGRLGANFSAPFVVSRRSSQEKVPWKNLSGIENRVEVEFVYPVLLGESILPYRIFRRFEGVVPVTSTGNVLDADAAATRGLEGLNGWMQKAEKIWRDHSQTTENISLIQQFDYYGKLASQFPLGSLRVAYAASGTLPCAVVIREKVVFEHAIYWSPASSEDEAHYLTAILNSETARERVAQYQARGQWGARHFDKVIFNLSIPRFNSAKTLHISLARSAKRAEEIASDVTLPQGVKFQRARKLVRDALIDVEVAPQIEAQVAQLLD